jgi:hypothetical protein
MNTNSLLSAFRLFRVKREERPLATVMLLVFLALDALVICKYYDVFTPQTIGNNKKKGITNHADRCYWNQLGR